MRVSIALVAAAALWAVALTATTAAASRPASRQHAADLRRLVNPLDLTDADLDAGGDSLRRAMRAAATAPTARAPRPARPVAALAGPSSSPLDLTGTAMRTRSDGEIYTAIVDGATGRGMPAFADLAETARWQLVAWVRSLGGVRLRVRATDGGAGYAWDLPPGFPQPKVPADNPMTSGEGRARPLPVLRHAAVGRRHVLVRHLPRAAAGVHRRQAAGGRPQRPDPSAQRDGARQRRLPPGADLGRSDRAAARGAGAGADVRHRPGGAGTQRVPSARCWPGWPPSRAIRRCSRPPSPASRRRSPSATSPRRSPRSSGRCCRADRRTTWPAPAPTRAPSRRRRRAARTCSSPSAPACFHCHGGFNFTESVDFVGRGLPGIEFHNTGLYNLDAAGAYPRPIPASTPSPASATTWAASGRRRCATSR